VIAVAQQERADEPFGGRQLAFAEQTRRGDDLWRHRFQLVRVRGGHPAVFLVTDHLVEPLEHAPGGGQSGVDLNRALVGLNRALRVPDRDVAVTALLIELARTRVMALHVGERVEGILDLTRLPLSEGEQVEDVPVLGIRRA